MAFAYLNPQGRIWQANGLNYLLFPQDLPPEDSLCSVKALHPDIPQKTPASNKSPSSSRHYSSPRPLGSREQGSVHAPDLDLSGQENKRPKARSDNSSGWQASSPESWPGLWQEQFQRTHKGLFAWTYMDLGMDLLSAAKGGKEDTVASDMSLRKLRSQCLRKLFADLSHPVGTHTFWPVALPDEDRETCLPNLDCFWSGLDHLNCRGVIFMGKKAASAAMGTDDLKPLTQQFKFGKLVWILWEPQEIARNLKVYNTVLPFLKRSLGQFIRG